MQAINSSSVSYVPAPTPSDKADLVKLSTFLTSELNRISASINLLALGHVDMIYAVPARPRDGDIRLADGTSWNPGSGKGFYGYYNTAWHLLG